jgi:hypothetical protein
MRRLVAFIVPRPFSIGRSVSPAITLSVIVIFLSSAHSPDNSFMGFAVPRKSNIVESNYHPKKKIQGLIYGKAKGYYRVSFILIDL